MAKESIKLETSYLVPVARSLEDQVQADVVYFEKLYKIHVQQMSKSMQRHAYIEAYLFAWSSVEQILLPSLIRSISHKAGLKEIPKIEKKFITHVIDHYYFLSHDLTLYKKLCEGNKERNKIIHAFVNDRNVINKRCKIATKYVIKHIALPILDRLVSKTSIPMLTLYSRGWNDCRVEIIKRLKTLKKSIEK